MARYFNYFPKTLYTANNRTTGLDTVTNIISRYTFEPSLKQNSAAFYEYNIQDSDTPEIIASKFYDSPERHWIVLAFNEIYDPQWDWPLRYETFIKYVDTKYSSPEYADTANTSIPGLSYAMNVNNVEAYFKIVTRTNSDNNVVIEKLEVDANTWVLIGETTQSFTLQDGSIITQKITKEKRTYYEFENETNEEKRSINLLKPSFVESVEKEFKKVIRR